jgi:hypothetical protein
MGYDVETGLYKGDTFSYWSEAECIAVDEKTGERLGAADFRSDGKALGY